jgi:hypothetical protein
MRWLLLLAAGRLDDIMDYPFNPTSPERCESYCKKVAGCNAWATCAATGPGDTPAGCGAGCLAWGAAHNPDKAGFVEGTCNSGECVKEDDQNSGPCFCIYNLQLPVEAVGTFRLAYPRDAGAHRGCMPKCAAKDLSVAKHPLDPSPNPWMGFTCGQCSTYFGCKSFVPSDQFAFGMCTLLSVPDPAKPTFLSGQLSSGWVSGTLQLPKECAGLSWNVCDKCKKAALPDKCRACVRGLKLSLNQQLEVGSGLRVECKSDKGVICNTVVGWPWEHQCGVITQKQLLEPAINPCVEDRKRRYECRAVASPLGLLLSFGATVQSAG